MINLTMHTIHLLVTIKQSETYSPRSENLILQSKKGRSRKTLLEAKPKMFKGLFTLSGRALLPASRYKNGGVFTRLVPDK